MSRNSELHTGIHGDSYQADLEPVTAHVVAQYHNANGGSSFHVHGGERAKSGYAVGGLEGAPESVGSDPLTADEWQSHRDRVRSSVKNPQAIAGTWNEGGKSVMDASEAVASRDEAKRKQIDRGERRVYNLGSGQEEDLR